MIERIAHRGNSYAARENTPAAFAAALEAGCDLVELDVRTTADGCSVVLHDTTTLRLWGVPRRVADMSAAEIAGLGLGPVRIPTLAEVLELLAGSGVGVLIDTVCVRDARAALAVVRGHAAVRAGEAAVQWCGATEAMQAIRAADPDAVIRYAADGGLDDAALRALQPAYMNSEWTTLTAEQVAAWHAQGYRVACWTPDDAVSMRACRDAGVDAITTNRLRLLDDVLRAPAAPVPSHGGLDLARCLTVATEIGDAVLRLTRDARVSATTAKASLADVVTDVDLAVERLVRSMLADAFPDHLVVGEEYGGRSEPGRPTWYVDPVDGTTNLSNGIAWTSLSLGLALDDQPLLGVVVQPWTGDVAAAASGAGVTLNGVPCRPAPITGLAGSTVLLELAAQHPWPGMYAFVDAAAGGDATARIMGSGTLTLTLPALGRGAAGAVNAFNPIDHLAAVVIAREAGCAVLHPDGAAPAFPRRGEHLLVAAPGVAAPVTELWRAALDSTS